MPRWSFALVHYVSVACSVRFLQCAAVVAIVAIGCDDGDASDPCAIAQVECVGGEQVTFTVTPFELGPGQEQTRCLYFDWPEDAYIKEIVNTGSDVLHHIALAQVGDDLALPPGTERPCGNFLSSNVEMIQGLVFASGGAQTMLRFPSEDYGIFVGRRSRMIAEVGFLNLSDQPRTVSAPIRLSYTKIEPPKLVGAFVLDNTALEIPPNAVSTCPNNPITCHVEVATSPPFPPGELFWASMHFHSRGVLAKASIVRANDSTEEDLITETSFFQPQLAMYDPPIRIDAGDRFRWRCHYYNAEDRVLSYSSSSLSEEMCALALYIAY